MVYGSAGLKTHAKVSLVVRREADGIRRYVHLSTGNYNATTARLYTDLGLFTADPRLGEDVTELFNALTGFSKQARYRKLVVAPVTLRTRCSRTDRRETERARRGKPARIFAKMNALVDVPVIRRALRARRRPACAIDLCVRGICCLRPGVPGVTENIRVVQHRRPLPRARRVFVFGAGEDEELFLVSADWMPRNLDRRVEVMFPVEDRRCCAAHPPRGHRAFADDNRQAYRMDTHGVYTHEVVEGSEPKRSAQEQVLDRVVRSGLHAVPARRSTKNVRKPSAPRSSLSRVAWSSRRVPRANQPLLVGLGPDADSNVSRKAEARGVPDLHALLSQPSHQRRRIFTLAEQERAAGLRGSTATLASRSASDDRNAVICSRMGARCDGMSLAATTPAACAGLDTFHGGSAAGRRRPLGGDPSR